MSVPSIYMVGGHVLGGGAGIFAPPGGGGGSGFYPVGHWQAAKQPMRLVYPRPDSETQTFARHRKAYYDGANPVTYIIPVGVQYGALPLVFSVSGPSGMTIGAAYGSTNYGVVTWIPTGSVTNATVTVTVTDQALNTLTVTWTVSTSSSTSDFVFISPSGNDSTGTGAIGTPYQTLNKVYGNTGAASTFPDAQLYLRNGSYSLYDNSSTFGIELSGGNNPIGIMGFPGETATISLAAAGTVAAFNTNGSEGNDLFIQNIAFSGTRSSSTGFQYFYLGQLQSRQTFHQISCPNVFAGSSPVNNATILFFNATSSYRNYIYINGCSETNRSGSGNQFGITSMFTAQYVLIENCSCTNAACQTNYFLKSSVADATMRYNLATAADDTTYPMGTGCQNDSLASQNYEICYNTIVRPQGGDAALSLNIQADTCGTHWVYRNSVISSINCEDVTGNGPFTCENNAIMATSGNNPVLINYANSALPGNVTNTGTECQASSGVLSLTTYLLIGTYRATYLGQRGAEIA